MGVLSGQRPSRPDGLNDIGLSDEIWNLMERGWHHAPAHRPSLGEFLPKTSKTWKETTSDYQEDVEILIPEAGSTKANSPPKGAVHETGYAPSMSNVILPFSGSTPAKQHVTEGVYPDEEAAASSDLYAPTKNSLACSLFSGPTDSHSSASPAPGSQAEHYQLAAPVPCLDTHDPHRSASTSSSGGMCCNGNYGVLLTSHTAMAHGLSSHFVDYSHGDMASRSLPSQDWSQTIRARQENSWIIDDRPHDDVQDGSFDDLENMPQFAYIHTVREGILIDVSSVDVDNRHPSLPSANVMSVDAPTSLTAVAAPFLTVMDAAESVQGPTAPASFPDETM
jgi:hypothetical protein